MISHSTHPTVSAKSSVIKLARGSNPEEVRYVRCVEGISMILDQRMTLKNEVEYSVSLFNGNHDWVTEEEARINCPNKLKAYKEAKDTQDVDEDLNKLKGYTKSDGKYIIGSGKYSTATKRAVTKMNQSPDLTLVDSIAKGSSVKKNPVEEEEYLGITTVMIEDGDFNVLRKKKKLPRLEDTCAFDDNISEDDNDEHRFKRRKAFKNRDSEHLTRQFESMRPPEAYKSRRGAAQQMRAVVSDLSKFNMEDIKRLRSIRHVKAPTTDASGFIFNVEWMQNEGKPDQENTLIAYEDVRRLAPKQLCDFFIRHIKLLD